MKTYHVLFSKGLASLMLAGLCLCFGANASWGQCPTDIAPVSGDPGFVPWTTGEFDDWTIPGTSCEVDIFYCQRELANHTIQTFVYDVEPNAGDQITGDCDGIDPADLINDATNALFTLVIADAPCSQGRYRELQVYRTECWFLMFFGGETGECNCGGGYRLVSCGGDNVTFCEKSCRVCTDEYGQNEAPYDCTYTVIGATPDCEVQPSEGYWTPNTCYRVDCQQQ